MGTYYLTCKNFVVKPGEGDNDSKHLQWQMKYIGGLLYSVSATGELHPFIIQKACIRRYVFYLTAFQYNTLFQRIVR